MKLPDDQVVHRCPAWSLMHIHCTMLPLGSRSRNHDKGWGRDVCCAPRMQTVLRACILHPSVWSPQTVWGSGILTLKPCKFEGRAESCSTPCRVWWGPRHGMPSSLAPCGEADALAWPTCTCPSLALLRCVHVHSRRKLGAPHACPGPQSSSAALQGSGSCTVASLALTTASLSGQLGSMGLT